MRRRLALLIVIGCVGFYATTGEASGVRPRLGEPAPRWIQGDVLRSARTAFPTNTALLRQTPRVLALARDITLYGIVSEDGSYCVDAIGTDRGFVYGKSCSPIPNAEVECCTDQTVYLVTPDNREPPVIRFGRLISGAAGARIVLGSSHVLPLRLGRERFFLFVASSAADEERARGAPTSVQFLDRSGAVLQTATLPPPQPVRVMGTPPTTVTGRVLIRGAKQVIVAPDTGTGRAHIVQIGQDRTFAWVDASKTSSYVTLTVTDSAGKPLSLPVTPPSERAWRLLLGYVRS